MSGAKGAPRVTGQRKAVPRFDDTVLQALGVYKAARRVFLAALRERDRVDAAIRDGGDPDALDYEKHSGSLDKAATKLAAAKADLDSVLEDE